MFDAPRSNWWKVLGTFRWAIGLAKAHIDGSVPNSVMATSGRRVGELEYDLPCLLRPQGHQRMPKQGPDAIVLTASRHSACWPLCG